MMHRAWHSIKEVLYCFLRSSIRFPGHMGPKINYLNPILSKNARPVAAIKSLRFALLLINCRLFCMCGGWVTDVYLCIMVNTCIYFDYIFCTSLYEPNGFRAKIPYSGIFVLVWNIPNAILSLNDKIDKTWFSFLYSDWKLDVWDILEPLCLGFFSHGIKALEINRPWFSLIRLFGAEL